MTFHFPFIAAMQKMIAALFRQRLFRNDYRNYFVNFVNIVMTFLSKSEVFLEFIGKNRGEHDLTEQGFHQGGFQFLFGRIFRRIKTYGAGNFTSQHGIAFFKGRYGFGIGGMIQGTIAVNADSLLPLSVFLPEIAGKIENFLYTAGRKVFNLFDKQFGVGHLSYLVFLRIA
jgi:hypothetical protein